MFKVKTTAQKPKCEKKANCGFTGAFVLETISYFLIVVFLQTGGTVEMVSFVSIHSYMTAAMIYAIS